MPRHRELIIVVAALSASCAGKRNTSETDKDAAAVAVDEAAPRAPAGSSRDAAAPAIPQLAVAGDDGWFACALADLPGGRIRITDAGTLVLAASGVKRATFELEPHLDFNEAKGALGCAGDRIHVESQMPMSAAYESAELRWDGERLTLLGVDRGDPSASAVDEIERLLKAGKIEEAIAEIEAVEYPQRYFDLDEMAARVLGRALEVAVARHRAGEHAGAATLIAAALEHVEVIGEVPASLLVRAKNDHGFFLDRAGKHTEAEKVLREVVAAAPDRAVARLNLADCLYALGKTDEAAAQYGEYATRTARSKWPERVAQRCPDCQESTTR